MSNQKRWFTNLVYFEKSLKIKIGDGKQIDAVAKGDINILTYNGNRWVKKHLSKVLYVPDLQYNLFSAGTALDKGMFQVADAKECRFEKGGTTVAVGNNKLYEMQFKVIEETERKLEANLAAKESIQVWHERLGHQNVSHVKQYLKAHGVEVNCNQNFFCEGCILGKSHRLPFSIHNDKSYKTAAPGELIHADLCGPMQAASINGSRYYLLFKDDYSHYRTISFLKSKDETLECIKDFIALAVNETGNKLKTLHTDNGLEFVNSGMQELLKKHGICHQRTVAYAPEQNGSAERENRTIVEAARAMIYTRNLPLKLWAEAANTAVHILNCAGKSTIEDKVPSELWFGRITNLEKTIVFWSDRLCTVPKEKRRKLDSKAVRGYFIGYHIKHIKGFRIWFPNKDKVETHRDVIFKEDDQHLKILYKAEQDEPVQIFVFPEDEINEQLTE